MGKTSRNLRLVVSSGPDPELVAELGLDEAPFPRPGTSLSADAWRRGLVTQYAQELLGFASRLLGPYAGARELVREALVAALCAVSRQPDASFRVTSRTVLARMVLERLELRRYLGFGARALRPKFAAFGPGFLATSDADRRAEVARFYEALLRIAPRPRLAFLLHQVEGMATVQIASSLRCTPQRIENWLSRVERWLETQQPNSVPDLEGLATPLSDGELKQLADQVSCEVERQLAEVPRQRAFWRRTSTAWAMGSAGLLLVAVLVLLAGRGHSSPDALTAPSRGTSAEFRGGQSLELPGGARASLSRTSRLRVEAAETDRVQLTLLGGEAEFVLQNPSTQSFLVHAGGAAVVSMARRFSVALDESQLTVHVSDGSAHVQPASEPRVSEQPAAEPRRLTLTSGETWSAPRAPAAR